MDIDETLGALTDLVRAGKIRYLGSLDVPGADEIVEAQWTAERRGRERFVCEQPPYSMLARGIERDVLPACERYGMGVISWSPLAGGWLTGLYRKGTRAADAARAPTGCPSRYDMSLPENQRKLEAAEALALLAEEAGITLIHLALAFVLRHPGGHLRDHRAADDGAARERSSAPTSVELSGRACSTGSTRSSRPARSSTRPTRATRRPGSQDAVARDGR